MCLDVHSAPPNLLIAMSALTADEWRYPLIAVGLCGVLFAALLLSVPRWGRLLLMRRMLTPPLLLAATAYLFALHDHWGNMAVSWSSRIRSQPGFLPCQISQVDDLFYQTRSATIIVWFAAIAALFLSYATLDRALELHRAVRDVHKAHTRREGWPPVTDMS